MSLPFLILVMIKSSTSPLQSGNASHNYTIFGAIQKTLTIVDPAFLFLIQGTEVLDGIMHATARFPRSFRCCPVCLCSSVCMFWWSMIKSRHIEWRGIVQTTRDQCHDRYFASLSESLIPAQRHRERCPSLECTEKKYMFDRLNFDLE